MNNLQEKTKIRVVCIASDGETRRGSSFIQLTFKRKLSPNSPIHPLLENLKFMNFYVGDDDLTCDKDYKHIFKRWRNLLIRPLRGVVVNGCRIMPDMTMNHLRSAGLSPDHIRALFNPEDQQDVKLAFDMLKDIWTLPRTSTNQNRGFMESREALWILGKLLYHMVFPYLCVELSISEQLEHLGATAHLALALYKLASTEFIPKNLYIDLMIMIKNVFFCVAKAKVDDPDSEFFLILQGTDRLEELFGILRTMVGNDANLDVLQLVSRLAGTTEVSNILAKYPHWDRSPRRLKLSALTRESKEIPDSADHIKPGSWHGNVKVKDVSLQTSWNRGRRMVEEECEIVKLVLQELDQTDGVDILSPFGSLLFETLTEEDIEDDVSLESPTPSPTITPAGNETDSQLRIDVEIALGKLDSTNVIATAMPAQRLIDAKVLIQGKEVNKARALSRFNKTWNRKHTGSTDRLKRVQDISRFVEDKSIGGQSSALPAEDSETLILYDPIVTLIRVESQFWLCLGEVNAMRIDGQPVSYINFDMLGEDTVTVSYQMLGLRPATLDDDPEGIHDWRTCSMGEHSFTVPGRLILSINPAMSKNHVQIPFYLLQSSVLVALTASLFQTLTVSNLKEVPTFAPTNEYPYREGSGEFKSLKILVI